MEAPPPPNNPATGGGNGNESSVARNRSPPARSTSPTPIELINPRKFLPATEPIGSSGSGTAISSSGSSSGAEGFELLSTTGEQPRECYGHTCVLLGDCMYLFGGFDGTHFSDTLYSFSLETREWRAVRAGGPKAPKGRHFHAAVAWAGAMYVWGGKSNGYMNDLWRFEPAPPPAASAAVASSSSSSSSSGTWTELAQEGAVPSKRYGHSCVVHGASVLLFGGYDDFGFPCNDLHVLDLGRCRWSALRPAAGTKVPERFHHSAVLHHGSMYVFGGYGAASELLLEYRIGSGQWAVLPLAGAPPSARWGHRAACVRDCMLVLGGCDQIVNYSDMYAYSFASASWARVPARGYQQRFFHALVATRAGELLACGGKNMHNYLFNDVHLCRLGGARGGERPNTLAADMRALLANARHTGDAVLALRGGDELRAHRPVLLARCPKLDRLLRRKGRPLDPADAASPLRVRLKHVSAAVLAALLEYLYTGTCALAPPASPAAAPSPRPAELVGGGLPAAASSSAGPVRTTSPLRAGPPAAHSPGSASPPGSPGPGMALPVGSLAPESEWLADLLKAAAWLELDHLMSTCEARLAARMGADEVLELLALADACNAPDLRAACVQRAAALPELLEAARRMLPRELFLQIKRLARPPTAPPVAP